MRVDQPEPATRPLTVPNGEHRQHLPLPAVERQLVGDLGAGSGMLVLSAG